TRHAVGGAGVVGREGRDGIAGSQRRLGANGRDAVVVKKQIDGKCAPWAVLLEENREFVSAFLESDVNRRLRPGWAVDERGFEDIGPALRSASGDEDFIEITDRTAR